MLKCKANDLPKVIEEMKKYADFFETTDRGAKPYFFPQVEDLMKFQREGKNIEMFDIRAEVKDFVVYGVHACDAKALIVLDNVFLSDPVDSYYKARRDHGIIVALACHEPEESCFCTVFGIDPADPTKAKADVATWIVDGELYWKPISAKGEALTESVKSVMADADDAKVEAEKSAIAAIADKLPNGKLSLEGWGTEEVTMEKFNSPLWNELYKGCLACGTCTFSCPTCQCYDIKDYTTKDGIQRYRCWDSCMYSDFTLMAGGNNRTSQMQRFRQRFMHKLVYYPTRYNGMYSCVGCGRCVDKCPQNKNLVKVLKAFEKKGE